jgi:hypothetical protein
MPDARACSGVHKLRARQFERSEGVRAGGFGGAAAAGQPSHCRLAAALLRHRSSAAPSCEPLLLTLSELHARAASCVAFGRALRAGWRARCCVVRLRTGKPGVSAAELAPPRAPKGSNSKRRSGTSKGVRRLKGRSACRRCCNAGRGGRLTPPVRQRRSSRSPPTPRHLRRRCRNAGLSDARGSDGERREATRRRGARRPPIASREPWRRRRHCQHCSQPGLRIAWTSLRFCHASTARTRCAALPRLPEHWAAARRSEGGRSGDSRGTRRAARATRWPPRPEQQAGAAVRCETMLRSDDEDDDSERQHAAVGNKEVSIAATRRAARQSE